MRQPHGGPVLIRPLAAFALLLCLLGTADLRAARAGALGEPWEELIEEGVRLQDTKLRDLSLDALVRDAQSFAARPSSGDARVSRLYLLARAHGKRLNARNSALLTEQFSIMQRVLHGEEEIYAPR